MNTIKELQEENIKLRRAIEMLDEENKELLIENAQLMERIKRLDV